MAEHDPENEAPEDEPGDAPAIDPQNLPVADPIELEPGIYPGLDFDSYSRIRAINFSILTKFRDTAAHAHHVLTHEPKETPAFRLGHLIHRALLEPQWFDANAAKRPPFRRNTTKGKLAHQAFEIKNRGKEFLTESEWQVCQGIRASVARHATAREYLYGKGASELTIVWLDPEYGVLCKSRIDRLVVVGSTTLVVDVKKVGKVASLRHWQRSITDYGYLEQAAMYLTGLSVLAPVDAEPRRFVWLVCESDPPYLVRLFDAEYDALEYGLQLFRDHLRQYAECKKTGEWPGYPEGVETVGLPPWVQKTFDASL